MSRGWTGALSLVFVASTVAAGPGCFYQPRSVEDAFPGETGDGDGDGDTTTGDEGTGCGDDCYDGPVVEVVVAGGYHTCARLESGGVRCWGRGTDGQLGYGSTKSLGDDESASVLADVPLGGVPVGLDLGEAFGCASFESQVLRCWGSSLRGQLGLGGSFPVGDNETPESVDPIDLGANALAIDTGDEHACALVPNGAVRCWGLASSGQIGLPGLGNVGDDETPAAAPAVNVGAAVLSISTGGNQSCAIVQGGGVKCWGSANHGQLGYGNTNDIGDDEDPADVGLVDLPSKAVALSVGGAHVCALMEGGQVRCWGNNADGQLGLAHSDDIGDDETPGFSGAADVGGTVVQISAGGDHTCALLEGGGVRCWGNAGFGQLGYGDTFEIGNNETPSSAGDVPLGEAAVYVSAGKEHTCAVLESGGVRCWGNGGDGRLGYGNEENIGDDELPEIVPPVPLEN